MGMVVLDRREVTVLQVEPAPTPPAWEQVLAAILPLVALGMVAAAVALPLARKE